MKYITPAYANKLLEKAWNKPRFAVKGDSGRVLIIGGSERYSGCLALAGIAALRAGCDWVTIAAPEKVAWAVNCMTKDIVSVKLKGKD